MKKTLIIITSLILSFLLISCADDGNQFKIKYYIDNKLYDLKRVMANEITYEYDYPEIKYYKFLGWYDKETNELFDFSKPITKDIELEGKYEYISNLAGGEEGKYYDFSNLTDEELIEIAGKLEDVFLENMVAVPIGYNANLQLLNERVEYPVSRNYANYELYSSFTGEDVFRYGLTRESFEDSLYSYSMFCNYLSKGLYSYEFKEDFSSIEVVPYFAKGEPVKLNEQENTWKVYIDEGFKYADGTNVTFEDFVNAYEYNLKNLSTARNYMYMIENAYSYAKDECEREEVGISYNYEDKSIIFKVKYQYSSIGFKNAFSNPCMGPVMYFEIEENADFSQYKTVGEYVIKSFENNKIIFEKNPYYIDKSKEVKKFSKIEYHILDNETNQIEMVKNNLLDICSIPKELFKEYYNSKYYENLVFSTTKEFDLFINTRDETKTSISDIILFNNNFRKALYYGMDREKLIEQDIIPKYSIISEGTYIDSDLKIIYPKNPNSLYEYDKELALEYYIKALDDLIIDEKLSDVYNKTIEIVVSHASSNSFEIKLENMIKEYEELFNSQSKYPNIKIKFTFKTATDYYFIWHGDYQIGLWYAYSNSINDTLGRWAGLGGNPDFYYSNAYLSGWNSLSLIEYNGETFTYEALSKALFKSEFPVLIRNGEFVEYNYDSN